jgi:FMN phosphatase YigB (HAD superfamily)
MTQVNTARLPELHKLLADGNKHGLRYLSLDCFDTVLWRNVAQPTDVFFRMQHRPAARELGLTGLQRIRIESEARTIARVDHGRNEVTLEQIYRTGYPSLDGATIDRLVRDELESEQEACFAYHPIVELMQCALRSGLRLVIVSDTYLEEPLLRELLAHHLPPDVMAGIQRIFVSCAHGVSKADGLFRNVLARLGCAPGEILHLGDNPVADVDAPRALGLHSVHFVQYGKEVGRMLQMISNTTSILNPAARASAAMPSPFHAILAGREIDADIPEVMLGYCAAGPLLYAFADYLRQHADSATAAGRPAKYLFLMRDGYLPQQAFDAVAGEHGARSHAVEISRFVSYACSFRSSADIDRYLALMASDRLESMARQLLLPEHTASRILGKAAQAGNRFETFCRLVRQPGTVKQILASSAAFRARFYRYLERTIDLQAGDRLVFVDLGYSGTAQTCLQPVLEDERAVSVEGLYLLLKATPSWTQSRAGLIDPALAGEAAVNSLVPYVAALEMICTNDAGSVIDYTADGESVRKVPDISPLQQRRVRDIQHHCLEFVRDAEQFRLGTGNVCAAGEMRLAALGALGRMTFFPSLQEVRCMQNFYLDVNLNTDITVSLFDIEHAAHGMRRMGLFHALNEQRMNIPTELRYHSLESALSLLVQHRFQQDYSFDDFSLKRERVTVILVRGNEQSVIEVMAYPAHDGFYTLLIPVGDLSYDVGIQIGTRYEWLQLADVSLLSVQELFARKDFNCDRHASETDLLPAVHYEQIEVLADGLLHCRDRNAFFFIPMPRDGQRGENMVCLVNYRPIVQQKSAA